MRLKPIVAIALASAFAVTSLGTYAQEDEKKDEKKPYVISQSDEKKEEKNTYQSDEKEPKKPELIGQSDEKEPKKPELILSDKNQQPYPIQSDFEMHS
jgi:hypothetical protein